MAPQCRRGLQQCVLCPTYRPLDRSSTLLLLLVLTSPMRWESLLAFQPTLGMRTGGLLSTSCATFRAPSTTRSLTLAPPPPPCLPSCSPPTLMPIMVATLI